jgi:PilZ domain
MNIRAKIYGGRSASEDPLLQAKSPRGAKPEELESVGIPREEPKLRRNSRTADRHRLCEESVQVTYCGAAHEAQLINLSGGGAMLSAGFRPKLWDRIDLHLGENGTVECAVRWLQGERMGLEFAHETRLDCSADELACVLREVIARTFPDVKFGSRTVEELRPVVAKPASEEHRDEARHPLIWSGLLHHDYQSTPVRVRNISSTGAMIECAEPVPVGAEPVLELNDEATISATVQWAVGDQVGLRFHTPFNMQLLGRSKPKVAPATWVRPSYLQTGAEKADSPWDPRWNRLSVNELNEELEGFLRH